MTVVRVADRQTSPAKHSGATWGKASFIVRN